MSPLLRPVCPSRPNGAIIGRLLLVALFATALVSFALPIDQGIARPRISVPGLRLLKRYIPHRQRRSSTPRPDAPATAAGAAQGVQQADGKVEAPETPVDTLPPLPSPDPRRRDIARSAEQPQRRNATQQAAAGITPAPQPAPVPTEPAAPAEKVDLLPTDVLEPPVRNPRRLSKRIVVALPNEKTSKLRKRTPKGKAEGHDRAVALRPSQITGEAWSPEFIARAENECTALLANIAVESRTRPAFREGLCGAPAARIVSGLTSSPRIEIDPPATLTCKMTAGLALWFRDDVQPLAKQLLGREVKRLVNASSFVCRNRYGDANSRISEHAFANALDISGFQLSDGSKVMVEDGWLDINSGKSAFLQGVHAAACKRFGTVLGPNANAAHKDHLHVDMAPRRQSSYCR